MHYTSTPKWVKSVTGSSWNLFGLETQSHRRPSWATTKFFSSIFVTQCYDFEHDVVYNSLLTSGEIFCNSSMYCSILSCINWAFLFVRLMKPEWFVAIRLLFLTWFWCGWVDGSIGFMISGNPREWVWRLERNKIRIISPIVYTVRSSWVEWLSMSQMYACN